MTTQTHVQQRTFSLHYAIIGRDGTVALDGRHRTTHLLIGTVNGSFHIFSKSLRTSVNRRKRSILYFDRPVRNERPKLG
jgi:hypothetical protein